MADTIDVAELRARLILQDDTIAGLQAANARMHEAAAAAEKLTTATEGVGDAVKTTDEKWAVAGKSLAAINRSISGAATEQAKAAKIVRDHAAEVEKLTAAMKAEGASEDAVGEAVRRLDIRRDASLKTARDAAAKLEAQFAGTAAATDDLGKATKTANYHMAAFSQQVPDIVGGLLTGQKPLQVLIQQGGQVVQVTGGIGNALKAMGGAVSAAISSPAAPVVLAGLALAAFGYAAESAQLRMINLQNALRATRDDYTNLAGTVETTAKRVAATSNIGVGDARTAATTIAAAPSFSGNSAELQRLVTLSRDLAATMGTDVPAAAQRLAEAMRNPGAEAQKLADGGFKTMSQALAYSIKLQADAGDKAGAYARVVDAMGRAVGGAGEPQTMLGKALGDLSKAFTKTGQDGKSFAEAFGGAVTQMAATAVIQFTEIIEMIEKARQAAKAPGMTQVEREQSPALRAALLDPSQRNVTLGPVIPGRPANDNQAVGLMQVMPSTAYGLQLDPFKPDQNVQAGMQTFRDFKAEAGGDTNAALTRYSGNVGKPAGAEAYLAKIANANTSILLKDDVERIEFWGKALGMSAADIEMGKRIAAVESSGQHYGNSAGAPRTLPGTVTASTPDGLGVSTPMEGGRFSRRGVDRQTGEDAFSAYRNSGVLSVQLAQNSAGQQLLEKGIGLAKDGGDKTRVDELTEALAKLRGEATNLLDAQAKSARAAQDSTVALAAEDGATRDLAEIRQKYVEIARGDGKPLNEAAIAAEQAAKLTALSVAYYDNVDALNRKADAEAKELPLLEQGGRAADLAAARTTALEAARKAALPNTAARKVAEDALTAAIMRGADAQRDRQAATDIHAFNQQIEYQTREKELLTATVAEREVELAVLRERQKLGLTLGGQANDEQQRALDAAKAAAELGVELQRQKSGLDAIGSGIASAFDGVGQAITQAFTTGEGKAIKWGNVAKGVVTSLGSMLLKLGVMTPFSNFLTGKNEGTLWGGLAALTGGSGGTGVTASGAGGGLSGLGDILGLGKLLGGDGLFSNIGSTLGLTGPGGLLSTSLISGIGESTNAALGAMGGAYGPATFAQVSAAGSTASGATLGSLLGGAGAGFGAGMLLNSLMGGNQLGGTIGSGGGALAGALIGSIVPGIGTMLGGLIGGALGGAGGGMFGPGPSVKGYGLRFQSAGFADAGQNDMAGSLLPVDRKYYNDSGKAAFDQATQVVAAVNTYLAANGLQVGGAGIISGTKNGPDAGHTVSDAFAALRFSAPNNAELSASLSGKTFDDPGKLQTWVDGLLAAQAAIAKLGTAPVATFTAQMDALNKSFEAARATADTYGLAQDKLWTEQARQVAELEAARTETLRLSSVSMQVRRQTALGNDTEAARLTAIENATKETKDFAAALDALALSAEDKANRMNELAEVQALEAAAIVRQAGQAAADALKKTNDDLVAALLQAGGGIRQYIDNLKTGSGAGASPIDRLYQAQANFERDKTLAIGGDRDALARITSTADAMLAASKDVNASGPAFQVMRQYIIDALGQLPAVQSYDAIMSKTLTDTQALLASGTIKLTAGINPQLNLVTVSSVYDANTAASAATLGAMHASMYTIAAVTNSTLGGIHETDVGIAATLIQATGVLGMIFNAVAAVNASTGVVASAVSQANVNAVAVGNATNTALGVSNGSLAVVAANVANGAAAQVAAQGAGNTIAANASAASVAGLAAITTGQAGATTALLAAQNAGNTIGANTATSLGAYLQASNLYLAAGNTYLSAANTYAAAANVFLADIATKVGGGGTGTGSGFPTLTFDKIAANTNDTAARVASSNISLATINGTVVGVNTSLGTINTTAVGVNTSLGTVNGSVLGVNTSLGTINGSIVAGNATAAQVAGTNANLVQLGQAINGAASPLAGLAAIGNNTLATLANYSIAANSFASAENNYAKAANDYAAAANLYLAGVVGLLQELLAVTKAAATMQATLTSDGFNRTAGAIDDLRKPLLQIAAAA